jgi:hypothetical protein
MIKVTDTILLPDSAFSLQVCKRGIEKAAAEAAALTAPTDS